ncbi:MAG: hypothetical protein Kow00121_36910 [Elainellaceae cyanobacterium]
MKSSPRSDTSFKQITNSIPPEIAATFTPQQLEGLQQACRQVAWRNQHAIDIRFSIPIPKQGVYVVFLAGRERRSPQRLRSQQASYSRKILVEIACSALLLSGIAAITVFKVILPMTQFVQETSAHPTGIPWLQDETACQDTGRNWQNGECWDQEHDPNF